MTNEKASKTTTIFQTHIDNALENISGKNINTIQDAINTVEVDTISAHGKIFKEESLFILRNNPNVNYLFMMEFDTLDDVMRNKSFRYRHDAVSKFVSTDSNSGSSCVIHSVLFKTQYGKFINYFALSADAIIPVGSTIKYYLTNDLANYYPIRAGNSLVTEMPWSDDKVYIKIDIIANKNGEAPKLYNLSLFCRDNQLTSESAIIDPNLLPHIGEPDETVVGDTVLQYDSVTGLLIRATDPTGISTDLMYDSNDNLLKTEKIVGAQTIKKELVRDSDGRVIRVKTTLI